MRWVACLLLLTGCSSARVDWIDARPIGFEIIHDKADMPIDADLAGRLFPKPDPGWREMLPSTPGEALHARGLPEGEKFRKLMRPAEGEPFARVMRYSDAVAQVKLLKPRGSYLWHHYYECLGSFMVRRSPQVDGLLGIGKLEGTYGRLYEGIRQGSAPADVLEALGRPLKKRMTQAVGFYFWSYPGRGITVVFQDNRVKEIRAE